MNETVYVVDDDPDVLDAIAFLLENEGYGVTPFSEPRPLLEQVDANSRGCLILDVRLPEMDGLQLLEALRDRGVAMPAVFISGHGDIPLAVRAGQAGARGGLGKPIRDEVLLDKVQYGLELDREAHHSHAERAVIEARLDELTPRERDVMEGMIEGKLNKLIGHDLDVSVRTVEVHRANVLDKLRARNSSDMVRMVLSTERYKDWLL